MKAKGVGIVWLAIMLVLARPVSAQTIHDGIAAFQAGDYATAQKIWSPMAQGKSMEAIWANYYMGVLYEEGKGVKRSIPTAKEYYEKVYNRLPRFMDPDEEKLKFGDQMPMDAIYRLSMIWVAYAKKYEASEDKTEASKAPMLWQQIRVTLDRAGFRGHGLAFFKRAIITEHGMGKGFIRDRELAWALYTLAAEQGYAEGAKEAARLGAAFNQRQIKKANEQLDSYRKYIRVWARDK